MIASPPATPRRLLAITRAVSPGIGRCELTHRSREPIDLDRACSQHREYEECLVSLGCELLSLPADPDLPDSVFVEDTAIVLDEAAVITRPGAAVRRAETDTIARELMRFRPLGRIQSPATLDGGDVLRAGRALFVGMSSRSNAAAVGQLSDFVRPLGYSVKGIPIHDCLHLKSAVTAVADDTLLINGSWVDRKEFREYRLIEVDPAEPWGANALRIGDTVIHAASFPRTRDRLERHGLAVRTVDLSEMAKAEGAITCCSLVFTL